MTESNKIVDGKIVVIGGQEYVFADLNFKTLQKIFPFIQLLSQPSNPDYMDAILKIITAGLQRNYPNITEDFVGENLEAAELSDVMEIVTQQLTKKKNQVILTQVTNQSIGEESIPE